MPNISIIIPCYNVHEWIDRCLYSVINQTIGINDIEIICVDDCSTDSTLEKLAEWEAKYPNKIVIVKNTENTRQGAARNIGLEYASGDYIVFIDSDDWIELNYLEIMYNLAISNDYEIVCCNLEKDFSEKTSFFSQNSIINDVETTEYLISSNEQRKQHILFPKIPYSACAKIIKKSFLIDNKIFFPKNITYEDVGWGSLLNLYFSKACIVHTPLYHYFMGSNSTIRSKNSLHHIDCLTVQTQIWREYINRGFYKEFRYELEIEHLYLCYLMALKMIILRFEEPEYNIYLLLREQILDRIPNYKENPYVKNGIFKEKHMLMLSAIDNQLTKDQFNEFSSAIAKISF